MRVIFFDIDETLIDQQRAEVFAAARFLEAFGQLLPREYSVPEFCGVWRHLREQHAPAFLKGEISFHEQRRRRLRELFGEPGLALSDHEVERRLAAYLEPYRQAWGLFDDVVPCLDALAEFRLGIISNGSEAQQLDKLRRTGICERFELIVVSEAAGCAKPDRRIFLAACRQARARPEECLYVGDRLEMDALGSRAAGLRGIWLNRRNPGRQAAVESIHSLAELAATLSG